MGDHGAHRGTQRTDGTVDGEPTGVVIEMDTDRCGQQVPPHSRVIGR
jgi:hypothetical protein